MADTPTNIEPQAPAGETVTAPSNGQAAPVTPEPDNTGGSEQVKDELQKQMRANQLANERIRELEAKVAAREKAEAEAATKELEEKEEYKTLLEQERAKREELEREKEAEAKAKELAATKAELLKDYPDEIKGLAEDAGVELTDTTDEATNSFKERLDKIAKRVQVSEVTPNNPGVPSTPTGKLSPQEWHDLLKDPVKLDEYYKKHPKDYPITNLMMK